VGHEYPVQAAEPVDPLLLLSVLLLLFPPPPSVATTTTTTTTTITILAEKCVHFSYSLKLVKAALPDI
jgi:hypothetical protein